MFRLSGFLSVEWQVRDQIRPQRAATYTNGGVSNAVTGLIFNNDTCNNSGFFAFFLVSIFCGQSPVSIGNNQVASECQRTTWRKFC